MTIYVSDLGITKKNPYSDLHSRVDYVSFNERANQSAVEKVRGVDSVASSKNGRSAIEEARTNYVIDTTPAYTVDFTSAGKVALKTFGMMKNNSIKRSEEDTKDTNSGKSAKSARSVAGKTLEARVPVTEKLFGKMTADTLKVDTLKAEPLKEEPPKAEPPKAEPPKAEPLKAEPLKEEPLKEEPLKEEPLKEEPLEAESLKTASLNSELTKVGSILEEEADTEKDRLAVAPEDERDQDEMTADIVKDEAQLQTPVPKAVMRQALSAYSFQMNFQMSILQ